MKVSAITAIEDVVLEPIYYPYIFCVDELYFKLDELDAQ